MLFQPPVEEMIKKVGSNYALDNLMAKRAKQVFQQPTPEVQDGLKTELQVACEDIISGKVVATSNDIEN